MASTYQMMSLLAAAAFLLALQVSAAPKFISEDCEYEIVESIPEGVELPKLEGVTTTKTHEVLDEIIQGAQKSLRIATYFLQLTPEEEFSENPATMPGQMILDSITGAARRGVEVEILIDISNEHDLNSQEDISALREAGISIKRLDMRRLFGGGAMHSKFLLADNEVFYIGSANFDWRSYTKTKEIGLVYRQCPTLAGELSRIYRTFAPMTRAEAIPETISKDLWAKTNISNPLLVDDFKVSLSSSPPALTTGSRRNEDIAALLHVLNGAKKTIDISIANYNPKVEFFVKGGQYWPMIEEALRNAVTKRKVQVRMLFSKWNDGEDSEIGKYARLFKQAGIYARLFDVPEIDDFENSAPYSQAKHDKYIVTDNALYLGTGDWAPQYFNNTCGAGVVLEAKKAGGSPKIVKSMQELFERDFFSNYARALK